MHDTTALVVVDLQQAFDDAGYWGRRNNPGCEANVAALLAEWRARGRPVVFVRHDSDEDASPLRPDEPGNALKPELTGEPDLLVAKRVNSAFYGEPDLDAWLRGRGIASFALCGITTNHCVETTVANSPCRLVAVARASSSAVMTVPSGPSRSKVAHASSTNSTS